MLYVEGAGLVSAAAAIATAATAVATAAATTAAAIAATTIAAAAAATASISTAAAIATAAATTVAAAAATASISAAAATTTATAAAALLRAGCVDLDLLAQHGLTIHLLNSHLGVLLAVEGDEGVALAGIVDVSHHPVLLELGLDLAVGEVLVHTVHKQLGHFEFA